MGNYRFRLADMMPNAWFYKLKNSCSKHPVMNNKHHHHQLSSTISTPNHRTITQPQQISQPRNSYYYTREVPSKPDHNLLPVVLHNSPTNPKTSDLHSPPAEQPRKSSKKTMYSKRRTIKSSSSSSSSSKLVTSSVSAGCSCRVTLESVWTKSDSAPDYSVSPLHGSPDHHVMDFQEPKSDSNRVESGSWSSSCSCSRRVSSSTTDIMDTKRSSSSSSSSSSSAEKFKKIDGFDSISELELPPILTKTDKFSQNKTKKTTEPTKIRRSSSAKLEEKNVHHGSLSVKVVKQESVKKTNPLPRRSFYSPNSPGLKLRSHSPRIVTRKIHTKDMTSRIAQSFLGPKASKSSTTQASSKKTKTTRTKISSSERRKKNHSDSFAIIKSSIDPQRDFRDSMVEMIVENNIRTSSDLEELLACYLSLNSNEYHDIIVKVFEQIWFDLTDNIIL